MWNIFSDLKEMGFEDLENTVLYDVEEETAKDVKQAEAVSNIPAEREFLYDKKYQCPICGKNFLSKTIRTGKAKLVDSDTDLKPNYNYIEPLKYDVIVCTHCGYASLGRNFGHLTSMQAKMVRENISQNYKPEQDSEEDIYTFEEAERRYKLALANAVVTKMKNSERAYLCLKLGWLYRSEYKKLDSENADEKVLKEMKEKESSCIKMAYDGLAISYTKEMPPICGMDTSTLAYLLSDLARQCGDYGNAIKYVSAVLNSRAASSRLKDRARDEKELISKETSK